MGAHRVEKRGQIALTIQWMLACESNELRVAIDPVIWCLCILSAEHSVGRGEKADA